MFINTIRSPSSRMLLQSPRLFEYRAVFQTRPRNQRLFAEATGLTTTMHTPGQETRLLARSTPPFRLLDGMIPIIHIQEPVFGDRDPVTPVSKLS